MWLHVPGTFLAAARAQEVLTSQSNLPLTVEPELYVTSSEKAMRRPLSWIGWRKRYWLKLLYGTVSNPLTADLGADLWISSLRVSRANLTQSPAVEKESTTSDGYGTTSLGYFAKYDHLSCSWRTSQVSLLSMTDEQPPVFSEAWPNSGSMRSGVCFQRARWAPNIDVSVCSSWPTPTSQDSGGNKSASKGANYRPSLRRINSLWMTPKAEDSQSAGNHPHANGGGNTLTGQSKQWSTPNVADAEINSPRMRPSREDTGRTTDYLGRQVAMWSTPRAADRDTTRTENGNPAKDGIPLSQQSTMWQTPQVDSFRSRGGDRKDEQGLDQQSRQWQTPRVADAHGAGWQRDHGIKGRERLSLTGEAKQWPSPQARDYRDGRSNRVDLTHSPDLNTVVETYLKPLSNSPSSHLDPTTEKSGEELSKSRRRLNRLFVEWLMNWPIGWTSFDFVETEYFRWREQSRSMFLALVSE